MFTEQLRRAVEASPRAELPAVSALLWKAFAAGHVTEAEASALSEAIEARKALPVAAKPPQRRFGSRPRFTYQHGKTPPLGRFWSPAARPRCPVHAGRASRPGCGRGRAREAR